MGKKGGSRHLKRKPAPKFWPIHRKEYVWTVKPAPGPHSLDRSLPLAIIVRDILGYAKTRKEAKAIISGGKVLVNGEFQREYTFPLGLMDIVSIPDAEANYRVLPHEKGFVLDPIEKDEASFKLCRIENKTVVDNGHIQLNLHDGNNKFVRVVDPRNPAEDIYQTLQVVKVAIPSGDIVEQIKLAKNSSAVIIGGQNRGIRGRIVEVEEDSEKKRRSLLATIEDEAGKRFQTVLDFVFVTGSHEKPMQRSEVR